MTRSFMLGNLEIHEDGKVYRIKDGDKQELKPTVLKVHGSDRLIVTYMENGVQKRPYLSREIAKRFVPNEHGYNIVSFKDGDSSNVSADNLIWISDTERMENSVRNRKDNQKNCEKCGKRYDRTRQTCPSCVMIKERKAMAEERKRKKLEKIAEIYKHVDKDELSVEWKSILESRLAGETLQAIGDKRGVTRQYIQQILKKIEKGTPQFRTKLEREKMNSTKQEEKNYD